MKACSAEHSLLLLNLADFFWPLSLTEHGSAPALGLLSPQPLSRSLESDSPVCSPPGKDGNLSLEGVMQSSRNTSGTDSSHPQPQVGRASAGRSALRASRWVQDTFGGRTQAPASLRLLHSSVHLSSQQKCTKLLCVPG